MEIFKTNFSCVKYFEVLPRANKTHHTAVHISFNPEKLLLTEYYSDHNDANDAHHDHHLQRGDRVFDIGRGLS